MSQESRLSREPQMVDFHTPVLTGEIVEVFRPVAEGVIVDATFGGGGHAAALLDNLDEKVRVLGIDRDPEAVGRAAPHPRLEVQVGNFGEMKRILADRGIDRIAGALFDFGVSRHQLDSAARGFSYRRDGPLDMRMGPDAPLTARQIVNDSPFSELEGILRRFGEEPAARRIAAAIVEARPVETTGRLSEVVCAAAPAAARRPGLHPARRTFQALRMAVNDELTGIAAGLEQALAALAPGGRCAAVSYHSLEDRLVKRRFRLGEGRGEGPTLPVPPPVELVSLHRKPLRPSGGETARNPSARSARLRAVEKTGAAAPGGRL